MKPVEREDCLFNALWNTQAGARLANYEVAQLPATLNCGLGSDVPVMVGK